MLSTTIPVDLLAVNWEITTKCNNNCPYCNDVRSNIEVPLDRLKHMAVLLNNIFDDNNNKIKRLDIIGGEPTIHSNFIDFINYTDDVVDADSILICSNSTRSLDFYKSCKSHFSHIQELAWSITYHQHTNRLEHSMNVYRTIRDCGMICQPLKIIINPENHEEVHFYHDLIRKNPDVSFTLKLLYGTTYTNFLELFLELPNYSEYVSIERHDDNSILDVPRSNTILQNTNFYYGMKCYPWSNFNLNVFGVTSPICEADRLTCSVKNGIFLIDNNLDQIKYNIKNPIICNHNCRCDTIMTPKFVDDFEQDIQIHREYDINKKHYPYIIEN